MNLSDKLWIWPAEDQDLIRSLVRETNLPPALVCLLINRGIVDPQQARAFLSPSLEELHSPWLLCGMKVAVQRIFQALEKGQKITVHGDYDADGITATVILVEALRKLGGTVDYFLPSRFDEGYGLHCEPLKRFKEEGTELVITVDCGINALAEINYAAEIGLDLIITDHHQQLVRLPAAVPVVNALQDGCEYPFKDLSGAGIAFKVVSALFAESNHVFPETLLDLAALGTAADVVPLIGENRIIVAAGLQQIRKLERTGFKALAEAVSLEQSKIDSTALAFVLAPAINAAGRMGEADPAARLLLEDNPAAAMQLAGQLHKLNRERRSLEQQILKESEAAAAELLETAEHPVITLAADNWHHGVIGIVASRLTEIYKRPVALIALENGEGRGSARSIPGFNITAALAAQDGLLEKFGGHEQAAGFTVMEEQIIALREGLNRYACQDEELCRLKPELLIEKELKAEEITADLAESLEQLQPFGQANPVPLFGSRKWEITDWKLVGTDKRHLKLYVRKDHTSFAPIFFSGFKVEPFLEKGRKVDLAFRLKKGSFREMETLDLVLKDLIYADSFRSEALEVIDRRNQHDREVTLKQLLDANQEQRSRIAVFCSTGTAMKKVKTLFEGKISPLIITGQDLIDPEGLSIAADRLILFNLPLREEQLGVLLKNIDDHQNLKVDLLYGSDDLELNRKMLDLSLPAAGQIEMIWQALAAAEEVDQAFEFRAISQIFPYAPFDRFWEKAELIFAECGLYQDKKIKAPATGVNFNFHELLKRSETYGEASQLRLASEKFQELLLSGSLEEIAGHFSKFIGVKPEL